MKYYAKFIKFDNHIFRTKTKIIFGNDDFKIAVFLCNPGNLVLADFNKWKELENTDGEFYKGEVNTDLTLRQVTKFINDTLINFNGEVYIYNLFNLKNTDMYNAIKDCSRLNSNYREYLYDKIFLYNESAVRKLKRYKFAMIGWGRNSGDNLIEGRKRGILEFMNKCDLTYFGMQNYNYESLEYMHLRNLSFYNIYSKQISDLKNEIKKFLDYTY